MDRIKKITTCSIDLIEDEAGRFYVCEFNQGLQSGGGWALWHQVYDHYRELFPSAFIEDYDRFFIDKTFAGYMDKVPDVKILQDGRTGLVVFRLKHDPRYEVLFYREFERFHPILVDPLAMMAVYRNKAYAAALDRQGLFPPTVFLTGNAILKGDLLNHFPPDQKIIIKRPETEATKGMLVVRAGDNQISLSNRNLNSLLVVQPVIRTQGYSRRTDGPDVHYNTFIRIFLTYGLTAKGEGFCRWWNPTTNVAGFSSASERVEAILLNRRYEGANEWPENKTPRITKRPSDAIRLFVREKIVPFVHELMSRPLDQIVRENLANAINPSDRMRAEVLRHLLEDRTYFTLREPRSKMEQVMNELREAKIIFQKHVNNRMEKLGDLFEAVTLSKGEISIRKLRRITAGVLRNADNSYLRRNLRLD